MKNPISEPTDRFTAARHQQTFVVPFSYPVWFGHDLFHPDNPTLAATLAKADGTPARALVYIDQGVADAHPELAEKIGAYFARHADVLQLVGNPRLVPGGEASKRGWQQIRETMTAIGDSRLCRQSFVVAIGGGSMLDGVGFAAALVHRGIRLVRVPTTVLAQDDAGVGVKNGMDEHGMKNFVGAFAPPFAVLNDFDFLRTLPDRYWTGGIAEAFKVALIKDAAFFDSLDRQADALRRRDQTAIEEVVRRCALLHLDHIRTGGDPFEFGSARPLDFGHWSAHKLEMLSDYALGHGQAVAIGMALDCCYAAATGLLAAADRDRILSAFERTGLPLWSPLLEQPAPDGRPLILRGLDEFREHLGGVLTLTLPGPIGNRTEVHALDADQVANAIRFLKTRAGDAS